MPLSVSQPGAGALHKRVVIVVGADRIEGIAGMFCQTAAFEGWVVVAVGLKDTGENLADLIRGIGGECAFYQGDAGDVAVVRRVVEEVVGSYGHVDAVVVGAASAPGPDTLAEVSEAAVKDTTWRNIGPAFNSVQAVIDIMVRQRSGRIVFIGSANAEMGQYGQPRYGCSKAGLLTLMKYLTARYARFGVQVNMASPNTTPNGGESWDKRRQAWGGDLEAAIAWMTPSRRLNTPADVAQVLMFLVGERCPLYGQELKIDGGVSAAGGPLGGDDWQAEAVSLWRRMHGTAASQPAHVPHERRRRKHLLRAIAGSVQAFMVLFSALLRR